MKTKEWYEKTGEEMTEMVQGKVVTNCYVAPYVVHLVFSDGDTLAIMNEQFNSWGLLLAPEDSVGVRRVKKEKQRLADAIKLLIANFARRTDAVVESIHVQHIPSTSKAWDKHIVDVNIGFDSLHGEKESR